MTKQTLNNSISEFLNVLLQKSSYPAKLGDGSGNLQAYFEDGTTKRDGFCWARVQLPTGATLLQIRCRKVAMIYDLPVFVRKSFIDGTLEAFEEDIKTAGEFLGGNRSASVANHAFTHGLYGTDALRVQGLMFEPFLTHPTVPNSFSVFVEPFFYYNDRTSEYTYFEGGSLDLSSYVPTGLNEFRVIITGVDKDTNLVTSFQMDTDNFIGYSRNQVPFTGTDLNSVALPSDIEPSAGICLRTNMEGIRLHDIFIDLRGFLSTGSRGIVPLEQGGLGQDASSWVGFPFINGGISYQVHCVGEATIPPTVTDDETSSPPFGILSMWATSVTAGASEDAFYICVDASAGAAVWLRLDGTGGSTYTDEQAQDAIGTILVDSSTIDFTYNDATPSITASVIGLTSSNISDFTEATQDVVGAFLVDGDIDYTYSDVGNSISNVIANNAVSNAKLADMPALSVKVRASNSSGDPVDLNLSNGQFLVCRSNILASGILLASDIPNLAASIITSGQLALARGGTNADLSATGGANQFLRQSSVGASITVSGIVQADIPVEAIDNTRLAHMAALTVKVRASNSTGDASDLAFSADGQFLVRRSSTLTVGTILSADLTSALTTPPAIGGTTPSTGVFTKVTTANTTPSGEPTLLIAGNPTGSNLFSIQMSPSLTTTGNAGLFLVQGTITQTAASSNIYGILFIPTVSGSNSYAITSIYGMFLRIDCAAAYSGTITGAYGLYVSNPNKNAGSSTLSSVYGVYVQSQTSGSSNWAILTGTGRVQFGDSVDIPSSSPYYLGDPSVDGTWRIVRSGNDLLMQRRISGTYTTKQTITG